MQVNIKGDKRTIKLTKRERETVTTAAGLLNELSRQLNDGRCAEAASNITEVLQELESNE